MAIGDFVSKVLVQFKGDTSDLKGKLKELSDTEKSLAAQTRKLSDENQKALKSKLDNVANLRTALQKQISEEIAQTEKANKALERKVETLAKVGIAVGATVGAYKALSAGLDHMVKQQRLQAQAAGVDMAGLTKASAGLRSQMDLLTFAARTNAGSFKLTQGQMETVLMAMRSLERKGYDSAEVFDKITESVTDAKANALEPFGIHIEATGTKAEKLQQILGALSAEAINVKGTALDAGEQYKQLGVEFTDAMSQLKTALGELAVALQPVIALMADAVSGFASLMQTIGAYRKDQVAKSIASSDTAYGERLRGIMEDLGVGASEAMAMDDMQSNMAIEGLRASILKGNPRNFLRQSRDPYKVAGEDMAAARAQLEADVRAAVAKHGWDEAYKMAVGSGPGTLAIFNQVAGPRPAPKRKAGGGGGRRAAAPGLVLDESALDAAFEQAFAKRTAPLDSVTGGLGPQGLDVAAPIERATYALEGFQERYEALKFGEGRTMLEQVFGPIESFDAYSTAWQALSTSLQAGFAAWVDGSKSFGVAMKEALKASLASVAADMFARSIQHAAMALGSLAMGDFRGAATHGIAAAKFGAGAIAVGVLARNVGGGSAGSYSSGGAGASAGANAGMLPSYQPAERTNRSVTLVIGDDFAEDSPRKRAQKAGRYLQMGLRQVGGAGVSFA